MADPITTVSTAVQVLYYGYKLSKELYDEYLSHSTVIFENEEISFEFYLVVRFKKGFQPKVIELDDKLRKYLSELDFDTRTNVIKIKKDAIKYEFITFYWMYIQRIPDFDELDEEVEEEDIMDENFVNDLTICLIPKLSDFNNEQKGKVLFVAKDILEEIGKKIQENFYVLPWSVKLNIKSNNKHILKSF